MGVVVAGLLLAAPAVQAADLRALVMGVDAYRYETPLRGALNDVRVIADAVRPLAKDIVILRDAEVTREAVLSAWRRQIAASRSGDTLLVTYSGHGAREWVGISDQHPRGYQEFWVMVDFDRASASGRERRVRGTDIARLVGQAHEAGVRTILVADHCYSGAIFRSVGLDTRGLRSIAELTAPGAPPRGGAPDLSETQLAQPLPGLTALGAGRADTPVSEFLVRTENSQHGGEVHGALSYAFAAALSSGLKYVDRDGRGTITRERLLGYLQRSINMISGGAQEPQLRPRDPPSEVLISLPSRDPAAAGPPGHSDPPLPPIAPAARIPVSVIGMPPADGERLIAGIRQADWQPDPTLARLVLRMGPRPALLNALGMFVAFEVSGDSLERAVNRTLASDLMLQRAEGGTVRIFHADGSGRTRLVYAEGTQVHVTVAAPLGPGLVVFNLTWDGRVELLHPLAGAPSFPWPASLIPIGSSGVGAPFGADLLVAVSSRASLEGLARMLAELERTAPRSSAFAAASAVLAATADASSAQVAVAPLFTVSQANRCDPEVIRDAVMKAECERRPSTP